jgi:predicted nuclease of predicted toxin-antitoxin system
MRFLADMGVDIRVVNWLRQRGHDAKHLRDEGLHRIPNGEIFAKAISENRVILTFDLDFGEIVALSGRQKSSVIVFRLHNTRTPHVIDRLTAVLSSAI